MQLGPAPLTGMQMLREDLWDLLRKYESSNKDNQYSDVIKIIKDLLIKII